MELKGVTVGVISDQDHQLNHMEILQNSPSV